jgi:hypothetical protein
METALVMDVRTCTPVGNFGASNASKDQPAGHERKNGVKSICERGWQGKTTNCTNHTNEDKDARIYWGLGKAPGIVDFRWFLSLGMEVV